MQLLCFRFVSYKDVISDGGRRFKGVHLSQVHQPRKALRNRIKKAAGHEVMSGGYTLIYKLLQYCFVGALETSAPPESTP